MKKIGWIMIAWIVLFTTLSFGQSESLNIQIKAGIDGKCKALGINPVKVILQTDKESVKGNLRVYIGESTYAHDFSLDTGVQKTFSFSAPILVENENVVVEILQDKKVIKHQEFPIDVFSQNTVFIGALSDHLGNYPLVEHEYFKDKSIEWVTLNDFDYNHFELSNVDFIWVDDFNTNTLSKNQEEILTNWIKKGHTLCIGNETYGYKNLSGMFENIQKPTKLGSGYVVPLNDEKMKQPGDSIMSYISSESIMNLENMKDRYLAKDLQELYGVADTFLAPQKSTTIFLLAGMGMYLAILTGASIMKRYSWVFSISVLGFATIFYMVSYMGFNDVKMGGIGIKVYKDHIYTNQLLNIYPDKSLETVETSGYECIDTFSQDNYELDPIDDLVRYHHTDNVQAMPIYQESIRKNEADELSLKIEKDKIIGTIENPLQETLKHCFLWIEDSIIPLKDLEGKESISIDESLNYELKDLQDYNYLEKIYEKANLTEEEKRIFEYYFYNVEKVKHPYLIGFHDEKQVKMINHKEQKIWSKMGDIFEISLQCPFKHEKTFNPVISGVEQDEKKSYTIEEGQEMKLYYTIPKDMDIKSIGIHTKIDEGNMDMKIYNYDTKSFENIKAEMFKEALKAYYNRGPIKIIINGHARFSVPKLKVKG